MTAFHVLCRLSPRLVTGNKMDKIIIKDLLALGTLGVNEIERQVVQDILINIEILTDLRQACRTDKIEDCINYDTLAEKIKNHTESAMRWTVEALAEDIASICLEDDKADKVIVRIEKPEAIKYTRSVGVEIVRSR